MLFIISLLLIFAGLACTLLLDILALQIIATAVSMIGVCLLIIYYQQLLNKTRSKTDTLKQQLKQRLGEQEANSNSLKEQLTQKEKEIEQLMQSQKQQSETLPFLSTEKPLEGRIEDLRLFIGGHYDLDSKEQANYRRFFSELKKAAKSQALRKDINDSFVNPLIEKIKDLSTPLDETTKHELLGDLMQLALIAIDYTQDFHSTFEGDDSLAIRVATKAMTEKEALKEATEANTNVYETVKELRVLLALVIDLGLTDRTLIVRDTLLREKE